MQENTSRRNNEQVNLFAMVRQIFGLLCVIVALIVVIKLQRGFELIELARDPSLLWQDLFSGEPVLPSDVRG